MLQGVGRFGTRMPGLYPRGGSGCVVGREQAGNRCELGAWTPEFEREKGIGAVREDLGVQMNWVHSLIWQGWGPGFSSALGGQ